MSKITDDDVWKGLESVNEILKRRDEEIMKKVMSGALQVDVPITTEPWCSEAIDLDFNVQKDGREIVIDFTV